MALDEMGGPNLNSFPCDAAIIVNSTNDEFYKQPLFYVMGHFSKFVHPDSVIIDISALNITNISDNTNEPPVPPRPTLPPPSTDLQYVGALNPDGSISVVLYNP